jgi:NRPS condensation-like uncharacterized protein
MSGTLTDEANVTTSAEDARVFPLPLSDFEYYMLVDDRPSHPMVFVMVVHLSGCLDRTAFQLAVASAVTRHPLFDSVVQPVAGRGWCWVRRSQPGVTIEWRRVSEDAQADSPVTRIPEPVTIRAIDLYHNRGLEIQVDEAETCSRIAFHLHHACCDGIGGLQFIGEILARYGQLLTEDGERSPEFEDTSMAALLLRGKGDGCADDVRRPKKSLMRSLAKAGRLIFRRPVPLTAKYGVSNPAATNAVQPCAIRTLALPRSVSRQLQSLAVHRQVSVNDLLLREMLLQIYNWNQACGGISGNPWLRVAVPVSMRTSVHQRMPAANLVSYAFVTRRAADCHDPEQLLDSIHRQTGDVLFNREGLVFLKCIRILRAIPGALRALLGAKALQAHEVNSWGLGDAIARPRACLVGLPRLCARRSSFERPRSAGKSWRKGPASPRGELVGAG